MFQRRACWFSYGSSNSIIWKTSKQQSIAKLSAEAEYLAMSRGESEVRFLRNVLGELNIQSYVDSTSAIQIAEKRESRNCRHIDVAYHTTQRAILEGNISLLSIPGENQLADILTKALGNEKHEKLTKMLLNL